MDAVGRLPLRIVVPNTDWKPFYANAPWMVYLQPASQNGLSKESAVDCFQIKSVSEKRLVRKLGRLADKDINEVISAIALCIGIP